MTVTLPGGPSGPSFSLAPWLCNGFLGCSFQALVEPLQFGWQVVLFHTRETLRGLEQAAVPKPQEPPARHQIHTLERLGGCSTNVLFFWRKKGTNTTVWDRHMNIMWIVNIFFFNVSKSMIKPNIFTSMTTINKSVPNNQLQLISFNISNTSWWWQYGPKVNQRNAVLVLMMMMMIAVSLFSSFSPLSV